MKRFALMIVFTSSILLFQMASSKPLNSDIIAVWDSSESSDPIINDYTRTLLHKHLEVIFNHYGFRLHYLDVNKGIPKKYFNSEYMQKFEGVVSWFMDQAITIERLARLGL